MFGCHNNLALGKAIVDTKSGIETYINHLKR